MCLYQRSKLQSLCFAVPNMFCLSTFQERIFEEGKDALQHEFRSLLNRHGRPVPAIVILDLLHSDEGRVSVFELNGIIMTRIYAILRFSILTCISSVVLSIFSTLTWIYSLCLFILPFGLDLLNVTIVHFFHFDMFFFTLGNFRTLVMKDSAEPAPRLNLKTFFFSVFSSTN